MKYSKKTLSTLTSELRSLIDQNFWFKLSQAECNIRINWWFDHNFLTESGKKRYPDIYSTSLRAFCMEFTEVRVNEDLLFCYDVDGNLYTTYSKNNPSKFSFRGVTEIPYYRDDPIAEDRILYSIDVKRGTYYPCGKVYSNF